MGPLYVADRRPHLVNLVILGTGALARLCYARFYTDTPVMVGRYFGPFSVVDQGGETRIYHPHWISWQDEPPNQPEIVLVAVKWSAMASVRGWLQRWGGDALVVSLLNGMGQESALIPPLDPNQLSIASTTDAVSRQDSPKSQLWQTTITHHGETYLAETGHRHETWLIAKAHSLNLLWQWEDPLSIERRRWFKLIANSVINPLSALAARTNGEILQMPLWRLASPLVQEAEMVARHAGIEISHSLPAIEELARNTQHNRSSMLQDVLVNIPTEVDAITGYIIAQAQQYGLAVPTHQAIYELVSHLDRVNDTPIQP